MHLYTPQLRIFTITRSLSTLHLYTPQLRIFTITRNLSTLHLYTPQLRIFTITRRARFKGYKGVFCSRNFLFQTSTTSQYLAGVFPSSFPSLPCRCHRARFRGYKGVFFSKPVPPPSIWQVFFLLPSLLPPPGATGHALKATKEFSVGTFFSKLYPLPVFGKYFSSFLPFSPSRCHRPRFKGYKGVLCRDFLFQTLPPPSIWQVFFLLPSLLPPPGATGHALKATKEFSVGTFFSKLYPLPVSDRFFFFFLPFSPLPVPQATL